MIAFLKGQLLEAWGNSVIVLTSGGSGYEVLLPGRTTDNLPEKGAEISLYISLVARENALELFGFETFEEKIAFEMLTSISRIGARTALAILSIYRPGELRQIVADDNYKALLAVPGIGNKTAQQIFLDLKLKIGMLGGASLSTESQSQPSVYSDVIAALTNLGYTEDECAPITRELLKNEPDLDVGSAIRNALKKLAKGKS